MPAPAPEPSRPSRPPTTPTPTPTPTPIPPTAPRTKERLFKSKAELRETASDTVTEFRIAAAGIHRVYRAFNAHRHEKKEQRSTETTRAIGRLLSGQAKKDSDRSIRDTDRVYLHEIAGLTPHQAKKVAKFNLQDTSARNITKVRRFPNKQGAAYVPSVRAGDSVHKVAASYANPARHWRKAQQKGVGRLIEKQYQEDRKDPTISPELANFRREARIHYNRTGGLLPYVEAHNATNGYATDTQAYIAVYGGTGLPQSHDMHRKERSVRKALRHEERKRGDVPVYENGAPRARIRQTGTDAEIYLDKVYRKRAKKSEKSERKVRKHREKIDKSRENDNKRIQQLIDHRTLNQLPLDGGRVRNTVNGRRNKQRNKPPVRRFKQRFHGITTNPR